MMKDSFKQLDCGLPFIGNIRVKVIAGTAASGSYEICNYETERSPIFHF
jgi:hypothetical protein